MSFLIAGLVIFLGMHLFTIMRAPRAKLTEKLGLNGYKIFYSLVSFIGLVLIVYGFGQYRMLDQHYINPVYNPPLMLKHLALLINLPVFILLAAAFLPGWIQKTAKHPMLLAVKLWATAHLFANGDLGSILLFAGFLAWAVIARIAVKRREAVEGAKARSGPLRNDLIAVMIGLTLYLAMLKGLHHMIIGVFPL